MKVSLKVKIQGVQYSTGWAAHDLEILAKAKPPWLQVVDKKEALGPKIQRERPVQYTAR